jgi:hypothetical protein
MMHARGYAPTHDVRAVGALPREYHSPGTLPCGTGTSGIGQIGSPVSRFSTKSKPCLVACASDFTVLPSFTVSTRNGAVGMS